MWSFGITKNGEHPSQKEAQSFLDAFGAKIDQWQADPTEGDLLVTNLPTLWDKVLDEGGHLNITLAVPGNDDNDEWNFVIETP